MGRALAQLRAELVVLAIDRGPRRSTSQREVGLRPFATSAISLPACARRGLHQPRARRQPHDPHVAVAPVVAATAHGDELAARIGGVDGIASTETTSPSNSTASPRAGPASSHSGASIRHSVPLTNTARSSQTARSPAGRWGYQSPWSAGCRAASAGPGSRCRHHRVPDGSPPTTRRRCCVSPGETEPRRRLADGRLLLAGHERPPHQRILVAVDHVEPPPGRGAERDRPDVARGTPLVVVGWNTRT